MTMQELDIRQMTRYAAAALGCAFGLLTLFAGSRVLLGNDPGYVVFRPLLVYNTLMGFAYIAVAALIWLRPMQGRYGAGALFFLNLSVLIGIFILYHNGAAVAVDSLRAMLLRTGVWLVILLATLWSYVPRQANP